MNGIHLYYYNEKENFKKKKWYKKFGKKGVNNYFVTSILKLGLNFQQKTTVALIFVNKKNLSVTHIPITHISKLHTLFKKIRAISSSAIQLNYIVQCARVFATASKIYCTYKTENFCVGSPKSLLMHLRLGI